MYRDQAPSGPSCSKHANSPAAATCAGCAQMVCDICLVYDLAQPCCYACAKKARRGRQLRGAAGLALVVGLLGGGVVYVITRPASFDYGVRAAEVRTLKKTIENERCDRKSTLALEEAMLAAGDVRGSLADSDAFFKQCGDWYRLRWTRYSAYERLNDHVHAVVEATLLVDHSPDDHDYRWWRGAAYEAAGKLDEAAADYRKAIAITPTLQSIPFNLARVLERQNKPCEAAQAIADYLQYHPDQMTEPRIQAQVGRLNEAGHCDQ